VRIERSILVKVYFVTLKSGTLKDFYPHPNPLPKGEGARPPLPLGEGWGEGKKKFEPTGEFLFI